MLASVRRLLNVSVFKKIPTDAAMNDILATLFHRATATMYLIYSLWAVVVFSTGLPSVLAAAGDPGVVGLSVAVLVTAGPACLGSTFWPKMARTELVGGSGFAAAMLIYLGFLLWNILFNEGTWAGWVLIWSIVVVPLARTVVIILFLLVQARKRKEAELEGERG